MTSAKRIPGGKCQPVDADRKPARLATEEAVEGHRKMRANIGDAFVERVAVEAPETAQPVHPAPADERAVPRGLECRRELAGRRDLGRVSAPSLTDAIDVPGQSCDFPVMARRHRQLAALRQRRGLQSEAEPAEIA